MTMKRRTSLGFVALLLQAPATLAAGSQATIVAVRVWPAIDYTRVTIESDQPLQARHFLVDSPHRLVIDVEGLTLSPGLRELIGNEWVHVIAKDPDTGVFSVFRPERGFVEWAGPRRELPQVARSVDYYRGETDPLAPALVG